MNSNGNCKTLELNDNKNCKSKLKCKIDKFLEWLKMKEKTLGLKKVTSLDAIKISKIRHYYNNFINWRNGQCSRK